MEHPGIASSSSFQASVEASLAKFREVKPDYLSAFEDKENGSKKDTHSDFPLSFDAQGQAVRWQPTSRRILTSVKFTLSTYSRKVFVGGLPPDISADEISEQFSSFGSHKIDWPHKSTSDLFPPKGFAFLLFSHEESVHHLLAACEMEGSNWYFFVSSFSNKNKKVQVRPWCLNYNDTYLNANLCKPLNPRTTLFVGGCPRLLKAQELAEVMNDFFGDVVYAGIDVDPWMKYPKGSARVCFSSEPGYMKALKTRFIHFKTEDVNKQVEVKPFVLCDQCCDHCSLFHIHTNSVYFCPNLNCLKYFCDSCWGLFHKVQKHQPLVISSVACNPFGKSSYPVSSSGSKVHLPF